MKSMNNATRASKTIRMINGGATWEDVADALDLSVAYVQRIVKENYKREKSYNNLLAKAKANKKAKAEAETIIATEEDAPQKVKEAIVVETGYLFDRDVEDLEGEDVFLPAFCVKELEKLRPSYEVAGQVLAKIRVSRIFTTLNLRNREEIFEYPNYFVKDRSVGVIACCCYLWARGYKVKLLTNSREIEELAMIQGISIDVTRVKK